jgi:hypothetical protein
MGIISLVRFEQLDSDLKQADQLNQKNLSLMSKLSCFAALPESYTRSNFARLKRLTSICLLLTILSVVFTVPGKSVWALPYSADSSRTSRSADGASPSANSFNASQTSESSLPDSFDAALPSALKDRSQNPRRNLSRLDTVDPLAASFDSANRKPDRFADNPTVTPDGARQFKNGKHFDLNKISLDGAIAEVNSSTLAKSKPDDGSGQQVNNGRNSQFYNSPPMSNSSGYDNSGLNDDQLREQRRQRRQARRQARRQQSFIYKDY